MHRDGRYCIEFHQPRWPSDEDASIMTQDFVILQYIDSFSDQELRALEHLWDLFNMFADLHKLRYNR